MRVQLMMSIAGMVDEWDDHGLDPWKYGRVIRVWGGCSVHKDDRRTGKCHKSTW